MKDAIKSPRGQTITYSSKEAVKTTHLTNAEEALGWCHKAGVTLGFTKYHVVAYYHLHPNHKAVGKDLCDAIHALRSQNPTTIQRS
jgi:hypothetical protein